MADDIAILRSLIFQFESEFNIPIERIAVLFGEIVRFELLELKNACDTEEEVQMLLKIVRRATDRAKVENFLNDL